MCRPGAKTAETLWSYGAMQTPSWKHNPASDLWTGISRRNENKRERLKSEAFKSKSSVPMKQNSKHVQVPPRTLQLSYTHSPPVDEP